MAGPEKLGYYEKRLCFLLILSSIPNAFTSLQVLILQFTPTYRCQVPELSHFETETSDLANKSAELRKEQILNLTIPWESDSEGEVTRSKCFQFEYRLNTTQDSNVTRKIACKSMDYSGVEVSAVTEFDLVCDRAWIRPLISSLQFAGMIMGSMACGYFGDRFGRRPVFLASTAWQFLSIFALSFAPEVWSYALLFLSSSIGGLVNYSIATVIGSEMTTKDFRLGMYFVLLLGYALGYAIMAPLAYWLRNWRWFLRFCGLTGLIFVPYYWLIDETPRWLLSSGRVDDAKMILNKIAKINGNRDNKFESVLESKTQQSFTVVQTIVKITKAPILVLRFFISTFIWFTFGLVYFALAFNTNNLSGSRFVNIALSGLVEIVACFVFIACERLLGRVSTFVFSTSLLGISLILSCLVPESNTALLISLNMLGKLLTSLSYAIIYVHILEYFPTKARQTIMSLVIVASRLGGILAPFLNYLGEEGDNLIPLLVVSALVLISAIGCAFLPETKGVPLPQTVQQAAKMTRKRYWVKSTATRGDPGEKLCPLYELKAQTLH